MKKLFRKLIGFLVVMPFVLAAKILSIFIGKEKAEDVFAPMATGIAKFILRFWVARINSPKDFDALPVKMEKKFRYWKLFYDIKITEKSKDIFKLHVANCPFCEVLNGFSLKKLSSYVCQGDWAMARENENKWIFEREHQIGTGDSFCDHTYKRKID